MKAFRFALCAVVLASASLTSPFAMALDRAQLSELGVKAGSWLSASPADSVSDFEVAGSKLRVKIVMISKDVKDRDMRIVSVDSASGQHSCHGLVNDGGAWRSPGDEYKVNC